MKRNLLLLVLCLAIAMFTLPACVPEKMTEEKEDSSASQKKDSDNGTIVKLGEECDVGELRWTILEASKTPSIQQPDNQPVFARGEYVIVTLDVVFPAEVSTINPHVVLEQLEIVDSDNNIYEPDEEGQDALTKSGKLPEFDSDNDNLTVKTYAVFDVDKEAKDLRLRIEDRNDFRLVDLEL